MDREQFLQQVLPHIGGKDNTGLCEFRAGTLFVTVKDRSVVDLDQLRRMECVAAAELSRSRLKITVREGFLEELQMAKQENYGELSNKIVDLVGGKENISFLTHCVTRLRFNVKDKNKVDIEAVKALPGAMGAQWSGDQLQVIIGQSVGDAYDLICKKTGLGAPKETAAGEQPEKKRFGVGTILDGLTGCLVPLMPVLITGGLFKLLLLLGTMLNILDASMPTYQMLSMVGDACFYFLPVLVGVSTAKKFGGNLLLGGLLGALYIHPSFVAMVGAGEAITIFGIPVYLASYGSTVFPAILSVFCMCKLQRFIGKHSPEALRSMVEPFLTILIMLPLSFCVLGPIGSVLGSLLAKGIVAIYDVLGFAALAIFAGLLPLLVTTGMHQGLTPYVLQSLATLGYEPISITASFLNNMNEGVACLAVAVKTKAKGIRSIATAAAITSIFGGVSEPALYGINLKYKKPLYAVMIGNFVSAGYAGLMHVLAYPGGNISIFGVVRYISEDSMNFINMIIAIIIGAVITFGITFVTFKDDAE